VLAVDGSFADDAGDYTLTTTTTSLSALPAGAVCERAIALTPGTTIRGSTANNGSTADGFVGGSCGQPFRSGHGRDAFHRITVPANRALRVAVNNVVGAAASGNGDVVVAIVSDCTSPRTSCLVDADRGSQLAGETVVLPAAAVSRDVFVVVDALGPNNGFAFDLTATLE
jgi:hypothetical protein